MVILTEKIKEMYRYADEKNKHQIAILGWLTEQLEIHHKTQLDTNSDTVIGFQDVYDAILDYDEITRGPRPQNSNQE